jgi:CDP-glucose 4,6-dehydratase
VASFASEAWGSGAKIIQSDEPVGPYEAGSLSLEVARARQLLGFRGRWSTGEAVGRAIRWYARQQAGEDARALCEADIADYQRSA